MAVSTRIICASAALANAGPGIRFETRYGGEAAAAFVIRHEGQVHAYLNRCAHIAMELDWLPGVFFDAQGRDLICSTHGAVYSAASGICLEGPCYGRSLVKLAVRERDGCIVLEETSDG